MNRQEEVAYKTARLQELMARRGWGALLLTRVDNFAWLTGGGRSHINLATDSGVAQVLVTGEGARILTSNIEHRRMALEELDGSGLEVAHVYNWWDGSPQHHLPYSTASDADPEVQAALAPLRWTLTKAEQERALEAGRLAGEAIENVARIIQPGETEFQVGAQLHGVYAALGFEPAVILVAADERIIEHRHPLPTFEPVKRYVMLVACCRRQGLYYAVTRFVHFGPARAGLRELVRATAHVDAALINATRPGARVADIFRRGMEEYRAQGYEEQWQLHHQGGLIGYQGREYFGQPESPHTVRQDQLFAWNPSITGYKSEDTILVGSDGNRILTETGQWPYVEAYGLRRPAILVR
jgi:Xaa-Pro aminopeptidase